MTLRRPLVVDGNNRPAEIPDGDAGYFPGGLRTRSGDTGGADIYARNIWHGPVSYEYWADETGARIYGHGPDGFPVTSWCFFIGTGPGSNAIEIDIATGSTDVPALTTTTQSPGDNSSKAATTEYVDHAVSTIAGRPFQIALFDGAASTAYGSSSKRIAGGRYFDPTDPTYGLSGSSTATLCMLRESTSGSVAAAGELFQKSGTGSPQIIAATSTTTGTTATLVTADVSAAFLSTSAPGIFVARFWIVTPNGVNQATCTGAWIEITP